MRAKDDVIALSRSALSCGGGRAEGLCYATRLLAVLLISPSVVWLQLPMALVRSW